MDYMEHALSLARLALGYTSPNPAVGAVIVRDGLIVGQGYTQPPGSQHAEVVALKQAGRKARKGSMYVTLEPCCHYARTPPCTRNIIAAGIAEVHLATLDPNPLVSGKGVEKLEEAGIKTYIGEHEEEAREINEAYIKFVTKGMPFVIVKFAMSLDGKFATRSGDSRWISGEEARRYVHNLRHIVDAIMVGINTILADDPHLTARGCGGRGGKTIKQPLRVVVDCKGRIKLTARIFNEPGKTLLAVLHPLEPQKMESLTQVGAEVIELSSREGLVDMEQLLKALGEREITSVLVEGGSAILGSLFDQRLVDKVLVFVAPIIIGGKEAKTAVSGGGVDKVIDSLQLSRTTVERFGDDVLVSGYVGG